MKTAVVTGTSYGLGEAIANKLISMGFKVYGVSRTPSTIKNKNFRWIQADLLKQNAFPKIVNSIKELKIDVLVNNAGVAPSLQALDFTDRDFNNTFGMNFITPIKLTAILKSRLENGLVIYVSSTSDRFAEENLALYCSSKAAIDIYFDTIALENINFKVIGILPIYVDTNMLRKFVGSAPFDWKLAITLSKFAEFFEKVLNEVDNFESGTRVMVGSNKNLGDTADEEKLYYYNVDTKDFKKLK